jgi:hypothetical protein
VYKIPSFFNAARVEEETLRRNGLKDSLGQQVPNLRRIRNECFARFPTKVDPLRHDGGNLIPVQQRTT